MLNKCENNVIRVSCKIVKLMRTSCLSGAIASHFTFWILGPNHRFLVFLPKNRITRASCRISQVFASRGKQARRNEHKLFIVRHAETRTPQTNMHLGHALTNILAQIKKWPHRTPMLPMQNGTTHVKVRGGVNSRPDSNHKHGPYYEYKH